jgi:flagella basal body P-ring formation protein FlgA
MSPWFVLLSLLPPSGSCQAIHADQITGEDLARAVSVFARIPHDVVIANSPVPGNQRIFAGPELQRLAKQYAVDLPAKSSACFEWRMRAISAAEVTAAIRESFPAESVRVEVLAIGKPNAPVGKLVFPLSGLSASANVDAATPVSWRGEVVYDGSHKFTVWARVRLSATITRVITRELLLPGRTVGASQIALETLDSFPLRNNAARSLDEVIGRSPLRAIKPGTPVLRADLAEPLQIRRGDSVLVMAVAGAAQLRMEAIAENSGKQGDVITLRNPRSGKSFRARIEGHDQALVVAGPVAELTGIQ